MSKAFCDSLDAGDTNVPPAESFLQLLEEEDGPTRLDSGTMQVSEPSDCNDLSIFAGFIVTRRVGAGHGRCAGF